MRSFYLYAGTSVAAVALAWLLVITPRLELAAVQLQHAEQQLEQARQLDSERTAVIQAQAGQLAAVLLNEKQNRELLGQIANQGRAHAAALQELKNNDESIMEYLAEPVPAQLGRLYQRSAGTDPGAYRQPADVPADALPASGPASPAGE